MGRVLDQGVDRAWVANYVKSLASKSLKVGWWKGKRGKLDGTRTRFKKKKTAEALKQYYPEAVMYDDERNIRILLY